jgi:hypothetical protein
VQRDGEKTAATLQAIAAEADRVAESERESALATEREAAVENATKSGSRRALPEKPESVAKARR